ncbi:MalM family protein [Agarivorans sp. DSG3-1]|uniref:MalM family protein n=1 Tax=Agarivorans sp. DSG3-1 TaxID=3342249 RepID=UPI00398F2B61
MGTKLGVVVLASMVGLAACSSGTDDSLLSVSADTRYLYADTLVTERTLDAAPVCCNSFEQIDFKSINYDYQSEEAIDNSRQAFQFNSGKSFIVAYELPRLGEDIPVTLEAEIGETVFAPTVVLLNENFQVLRVLPSDFFKYVEAKHFKPNVLAGSFKVRLASGLPEERERYMVVYTTDQSLSEQTQIVHPARTYAKAQAKADPGLPDPLIPHSVMGMLSVAFNSSASTVFSDNAWFGGKKEEPLPAPSNDASVAAVSATSTAAVTSSSNSANAVAVDSRSLKKAMLPETESFYNNLIEDMVSRDEVEKALKLVEEAEYAGSRSARNAFIEAVKNK